MEQPRGRLESTWTRVGGLTIHARASTDPPARDRPPVVLVHGFVVSSRYMIPTATRLAPYHRVFAPDLPGYGRSDKPPRILNVPELADALVAWMEAVGLERAALIANSFGCQIAVDAALRYPERVDRLVLLGPTVDPRARSVLGQGVRWLANVLNEPPELGLIVARDLLDMGPRRAIGTLRHVLRDRPEAKLRHVQAPTLVLRGELDTTVSQRWAEQVARLSTNGQLVVIRGAGHTLNYNSPSEVVRVALPFLADQRPDPLRHEDRPPRIDRSSTGAVERPSWEARVRRLARGTARRAWPERRRVNVDHAEIAYQVAGEGPPVILVHGLSGSTRWWARNVEALADRFRVYLVDLIGFGHSRGHSRFVLDAAADDLATWMERVGVERAHLIGHSMGGFVAARLAADRPTKVDRLVLVDAAALPPQRGYVGHTRGLIRAVRHMPLSFLPVLVADAARAGPVTIAKAARELLVSDLYPALAHVRAPTLVIWGAHDWLVPLEIGEELRDLLPNASLVVIEDAGHNPMWDRPLAFNRAVLDFLQEGAPAAAAHGGTADEEHPVV